MRGIVLACVALAALSLALPSEPSYDPWAWIVWGREAATLSLDTTGGPSWKPLPVMVTAIFAPSGFVSDGLPPALWLIVARAGCLMAMVLAFRVAARLVGPDRWAACVAGAVAMAALALTPDWLRYAAHGNEVPLAVALMLWAVERGMEGRHRSALVLGFAVCLLRPEAFPFVAAHAAWCWRHVASMRTSTASLAAALPLLWLVPEWIGSGRLLDAGTQARSAVSWSLARSDSPWRAALGRAHEHFGPLLEVSLIAVPVLVLVAARAGRLRAREARVMLALTGGACVWIVFYVALTEAGFSGSVRYLTPAIAVACLLAGAAVGLTVRDLGRPRRWATAAPAATAAIVLAAVVPGWAADRSRSARDQMQEAGRLAGLGAGLATAVRGAGGPQEVVEHGAPVVARQFHTRLAWETRLTLGEVERADGSGLHFIASPGAPGAGKRCGLRGEARADELWCVAPTGVGAPGVARGAPRVAGFFSPAERGFSGAPPRTDRRFGCEQGVC